VVTPLWQYAVFAVGIYSRTAAERLAIPVQQIVRRIAARHGPDLTHDPLWLRAAPETGERGLRPGRMGPPGVTIS
jgi:hypothetical protein